MARIVDQPSRETPFIVRLGISWLTNALILGIVTALLTDVRVSNFGTLLFRRSRVRGAQHGAQTAPAAP